jgi:hypothetical protein
MGISLVPCAGISAKSKRRKRLRVPFSISRSKLAIASFIIHYPKRSRSATTFSPITSFMGRSPSATKPTKSLIFINKWHGPFAQRADNGKSRDNLSLKISGKIGRWITAEELSSDSSTPASEVST